MNEKQMNIFTELIYEKHHKMNFIKRFFYRRRVNKFIKNIENGSPSFDLLWALSDFIKIAEMVFFYDNSLKNESIGLYSSKNYQDYNNGFKITCKDCSIVIKLYAKSKEVALSIERHNGEKTATSISFMDNQWVGEPTMYDEMLLEQVIKRINEKAIALFWFCYNQR